MAGERQILIERGLGRHRTVDTVQIPANSVLVAAAQELRRESGGVRGTYGMFGGRCVGLYEPPGRFATKVVDPFTGQEGKTAEHSIDEKCVFYHYDGRLTMVAVACFETDPPSIRLLAKPAPDVQKDLFAGESEPARVEGTQLNIELTTYERDPLLRSVCIYHHGAKCAACGMEFGRTYGALAEGYIHVHHRRPLASVGEQHGVDPIADLVPLCPNCHAVAHMRDPPWTPEEIAIMLKDTPF